MPSKADCFDIYEDMEGAWRWRVKAHNGEIVAASSQGFHDEDEAKYNAKRTYMYLKAAFQTARMD